MSKGLIYLFLLVSVCTVQAQTEKRETTLSAKAKEKAAVIEEAAGTSTKKTGDQNRELPPGAAEKTGAEEKNKETKKKYYAEAEGWRFVRGEKEINIEFGIAPFRPSHFAGPEEYDTEDRKLGFSTLRWGRVIGTKKTITYQYLFEVHPFVFSYRNEVRNPAYHDWKETPDESPTMRKNTYGIAVTPVAFRLYFFSKSRLKPFGQFGAGMMFTNKPLPLPDTTTYNFTGYFGGGVLYHLTRRAAVSLSYRYFHISNFNTTDSNPGYNANTFSVGYSYFFK